MSLYDGLEIDMISLGKADSILVTKRDRWRSTTTRVLIDGGNKGSKDTVRPPLTRHYVRGPYGLLTSPRRPRRGFSGTGKIPHSGVWKGLGAYALAAYRHREHEARTLKVDGQR